MSWLPIDTPLGDLRSIETLVFYDGPRVFSCESLSEQRYVAAWAEEGDDVDLWLYAAVSQRRLDMLRSGGLPLRAAFLNPEGPLWLVVIGHDAARADRAELLAPADVREDWLPGEGFFLSLATQTLPPSTSAELIELDARRQARGRLRLEVSLPGYTRSEAPTRKVGELLVLTQNVYDNVGLAKLTADPPQRGRIPGEIAEETATDVIGLSAASFVIELAANKGDDLFGESVFSRITVTLLELLNLRRDRDSLVAGLQELRPRGAKSFRNFVTGLASTGGDVTVSAASAQFAYIQRDLPADRLQTLVQLLNVIVPDDVAEIRGRMRLYRADTDRRMFGLRDELEEARYEGDVSDRAAMQVEHATLNELYDVVISVYSSFDEAVGERKPRYVLEQLVPVAAGDVAPRTIVVVASDAE